MDSSPTAAVPGPSTSLTFAIALLSSTVMAGLLGTVLGNVRANAAARRDRYALVVRCLVTWAEYPYRIRRRTDDDLSTLDSLADRGHTIQEQLAESRAWVAAESRAVSTVLDSCIKDLRVLVSPACTTAWQSPPVTKPGAMILGDFGPRGADKIVARMERAITYRFGIRRLMWSKWVHHRLDKRESLLTNEKDR